MSPDKVLPVDSESPDLYSLCPITHFPTTRFPRTDAPEATIRDPNTDQERLTRAKRDPHVRNGPGEAEIRPTGWGHGPPRYPLCTPCLRDPGPVETRPPASEADQGRPRYGQKGGCGRPRYPPRTPCLRDPGLVETRPPMVKTDQGRPRYGQKGGYGRPRYPPRTPCQRDPSPVETTPGK